MSLLAALLLIQAAPAETEAPATQNVSVLEATVRDAGLSPAGAAAYAAALEAGSKAAAEARRADRARGKVPLQAFMEAISGPTVDAAEAERATADTIERNGALVEARHKRIIALFQALSPEDRAKLAAHIARRPNRLAAF
jgi:hypothetical protein